MEPGIDDYSRYNEHDGAYKANPQDFGSGFFHSILRTV
jgi:hypothetical protein